jgi:uncharacterized protein (DUF305 family)
MRLNTNIRISCVLLLLASLLSFSLQAGAPAPTRAQRTYEVKFLENMIDHHAMAVMTGELCEEKAVHQELRDLCTSIVEAQQSEIELMQGWLSDWYGISYEPQMSRRGERMVDRLSELSGAEFEIAFMEMMIKHHEKAVKEGTKCERRAFHAELKQLCHSIIQSQSAEIADMEQWLCEWYGECN